MSERAAPANSDSDDFAPLELEQNKDDISVTHLQDKISKLEKQRDEDRFITIIVFVIFFNLVVFAALNWAVVISTFILEIFLLIAAGRRLKVKYMESILNKILDFNRPSSLSNRNK